MAKLPVEHMISADNGAYEVAIVSIGNDPLYVYVYKVGGYDRMDHTEFDVAFFDSFESADEYYVELIKKHNMEEFA